MLARPGSAKWSEMERPVRDWSKRMSQEQSSVHIFGESRALQVLGTVAAQATRMRDIRYAFRQLGRTPGFTAVALLTLALGMGANTAFFSVLYGVVLRDPAYPNAGRLVAIHNFKWSARPSTARLDSLCVFQG